jgi:hypothetical protein
LYLDCVLLRPDDDCVAAETCRLKLTYNFLIIYIYSCVLDGNKYTATNVAQRDGSHKNNIFSGMPVLRCDYELSYKFHLLSLLLQVECDEQVYEHNVLIGNLTLKQSC